MIGTVEEWIAKAEGDFSTASREFNAAEEPNFDAVCYHAQQCIEKLLKAVLIKQDVVPPRIHDLSRLSELVQPLIPGWNPSPDDLLYLTKAGIAFRYPGESATKGAKPSACALQ